MGVVCKKAVVHGKGGDEITEGGSVPDEEQRTENEAFGNATGGGIEGQKSVITHGRSEMTSTT